MECLRGSPPKNFGNFQKRPRRISRPFFTQMGSPRGLPGEPPGRSRGLPGAQGAPRGPAEALRELFLSLRSTIFARLSIRCFLTFATSGGFVLSSGVFVFALLSSPLAQRIVVLSSGAVVLIFWAFVFSFGPSSGVFVFTSGVFVFSSWALGLQLWGLRLRMMGLRL